MKIFIPDYSVKDENHALHKIQQAKIDNVENMAFRYSVLL